MRCSSFTDFLHFSRILFVQLIKSGYKALILSSIKRNISNVNREELIPYKTKDNVFLTNNSIKIFLKYDKSFDFLNNCVHETFFKLNDKFSFLRDRKIAIINTINTNIGSYLIHNFKFNKHSTCKYNKCNNQNCKVCNFSSSNCFLKLNNFV